MFSSYVLYDAVAIEAVYFPQPAPPNTIATTAAATASSSGEDGTTKNNENAPYALTMRDTLLHRLTERYVGRVIPSRGLCVAITDVMEYSASSVRGAAASAWLTATFGVCVFAPAVGTRLKARIAHQSPAGVHLSLDLFVSIPFLVPASMLVPGSRYHAAQRSWYLPLDGAESEGEEKKVFAGDGPVTSTSAAAPSASAMTAPHNKYLVGAEVIVKVVTCTVLSEEAAVAAAEDSESAGMHMNGGGGSSVLSFATLPSVAALGSEGGFGDGAPPIMELRGSFIGDALGPVSWFENA